MSRKKIQYTPQQLLLGLLVGMGLVNLIQSIVTQLNYDEAYYWLFSQHLDWGYFDHPPMAALMVWIGNIFAHSEWALRVLFVLMQPIYVWWLWTLIRPAQPTRSDVWLFFCVTSAIPLVQIYGFLATPDVPLMFFSALLLLVYKRFIASPHWKWTVALSFAMAALAYSKYHGALVVLLLVVSNVKLLRSGRFYAACALTLLLILPHLWWQYQHNFVSFDYHLHERSDIPKLRYLTEYLLNTFLTFNPFFVPVIVMALWRFKARNAMERLYKMLPPFFFFFFLASSYRGHAQPQWLFPALFGVVFLLFDYAKSRPRTATYLIRASLFTWGMLLIARVILPLNVSLLNATGFNYNREDMQAIKQEAGSKPVIFKRYLTAGLYRFYTGGEASVRPAINDRQSQFDLWNDDDLWTGREVMVETSEGTICPTIQGRDPMAFVTTKEYLPTGRCSIDFEPLPKRTLKSGERLTVKLRIANPYPYGVKIDSAHLTLRAVFIDDDERFNQQPIATNNSVEAMSNTEIVVEITVPELEGRYRFGFALEQAPVSYFFCSPKEKVTIML